MHLSSNILGVVVASAAQAAAETIVIEANNNNFEPKCINAAVGDILEFHFAPNNHSVVMGDLENPCQPAASGGFYSGFWPVASGENSQVFQVTIKDTNPMVFYCSQNASNHNHCKAGMIGFVNQPDEDAMTAYAATAADSSVNVSPDVGPFGGSFVANPNSSSSGNSSGDSIDTTTANSTATATSSSTETDKSTQTKPSASSSNTGSPHNNGGGAAMAGSGLLAVMAAVMAF